MATLNIKNLSDSLHEKLRARAKRDRRSLAQEVIQILAQATEEPSPLSILGPVTGARVRRLSGTRCRGVTDGETAIRKV